MAEILAFPREGVAMRGESARAAECEIIIFPGVRYERWDDAVTASVDEELDRLAERDAYDAAVEPKRRQRRGRPRKRDILEIPD